jgi:hypothetical protein
MYRFTCINLLLDPKMYPDVNFNRFDEFTLIEE